MVFKNGKLLNNASLASGVELLKLFANSPNNNGLSLYFQPGSLNTKDTTEFGSLMLQYADNAPISLKVNPRDTSMRVDTNILCFLFIVRYEDSIRVLYMTETNNTTHELARFNISNNDITFSNKELIINSRKNWNARLFNIGIWNTALTDVSISNVYQHIMSHHSKYSSPSYVSVVDDYNNTITQLITLTKCPFNEDVCNTCKSVSVWTDITQLLYTPLKCRKAVSKYCTANPTKAMCECWNSKDEAYNTQVCKLLRDAFEEDEQDLCKKVKDEDIECIKKKYQLIEKEKVKPKDRSNKYDDTYTFEKVRVKYNDDGLTTEEKKKMKMDVELPQHLQLKNHRSSTTPASVLNNVTPSTINTKDNFLDADDVKFMNDLNKTHKENNEKTGFWSTFSKLIFG